MVETSSQRLRRARLTAGFSSAGAFADAHGFPAVTYRAHESGTRNFKVHSAQAYAAALGLPHPAGWRWLMFGDNGDQILAALPLIRSDSGQLADERTAYVGSMHQDPPAVRTCPPTVPDSFTMIPLYDVAVSAGHGAALFDAHPVDYLSFSPRFSRQLTAQSPDQLAGLAVRGDSMEPTLSHGDHILVDLSCAAPTIDGVYVVRMDQSLLVKRLQIDLGSRRVTVISDNKKYAIINDVERNAIQVVGRVIWLSRRI